MLLDSFNTVSDLFIPVTTDHVIWGKEPLIVPVECCNMGNIEKGIENGLIVADRQVLVDKECFLISPKCPLYIINWYLHHKEKLHKKYFGYQWYEITNVNTRRIHTLWNGYEIEIIHFVTPNGKLQCQASLREPNTFTVKIYSDMQALEVLCILFIHPPELPSLLERLLPMYKVPFSKRILN